MLMFKHLFKALAKIFGEECLLILILCDLVSPSQLTYPLTTPLENSWDNIELILLCWLYRKYTKSSKNLCGKSQLALKVLVILN